MNDFLHNFHSFGGMLLLAAMLIGGALLFQAIRIRSVANRWEKCAEALNLGWSRGGVFNPGTIAGQLDGQSVQVFSVTRGSGKSKKVYTRVVTAISPSLPVQIEIEPEGFLSGVKKAFGSQDIEVGDADFDGRFMVKGSDPARVLHFLTADVRQAILRYDGQVGGTHIATHQIAYEARGYLTDPTELSQIVRTQVYLAQKLAHQGVEVRTGVVVEEEEGVY